MSVNQSFAVAMHAMSVIGFSKPDAVSAVFICEQISVHPVALRRLLSKLVSAGLLTSHPGSKGGYTLAKPANKIPLHQILDAVQEASAFGDQHGMPKANCIEGRRIEKVLTGVYAEVDDAQTGVLKVISLGDILKKAGN